MTKYNGYSEGELTQLLQSGDRIAFDEVYHRFWDKLFVTATNRMGNPHEAEDIVQDVMLNL